MTYGEGQLVDHPMSTLAARVSAPPGALAHQPTDRIRLGTSYCPLSNLTVTRPVAALPERGDIRRWPVLGGLINEYSEAA
jgi:hypothetical protein